MTLPFLYQNRPTQAPDVGPSVVPPQASNAAAPQMEQALARRAQFIRQMMAQRQQAGSADNPNNLTVAPNGQVVPSQAQVGLGGFSQTNLAQPIKPAGPVAMTPQQMPGRPAQLPNSLARRLSIFR